MRMTDTPYDAAMTRSKQELARQVVDANARIEALEKKLASADTYIKTLEVSSNGWAENTIILDKRIEVLEAALKEAGEMWIRKDNRIEALETELRSRHQERDQHQQD